MAIDSELSEALVEVKSSTVGTRRSPDGFGDKVTGAAAKRFACETEPAGEGAPVTVTSRAAGMRNLTPRAAA